MGVMRCNRIDCENILCDKHSDEFGYICNSCFEELIKHCVVKGVNKRIVSDFMDENVEEELTFSEDDIRSSLNRYFAEEK